jgi:hypothetical protein
MQDSTAFKLLAFGVALTALSACVGASFETVNLPAAKNLFDAVKTIPENTKWRAWTDCRTTYGNPAETVNGKVRANAAWEDENLVMVKLPWKAKAAWNGKLSIRSLQVHKDAAPSLERALNAVWLEAGRSQKEIDRVGLSQVGGGYNFRENRNNASLSTHAYGCAVDFDPVRNALGDDTPFLALPENRYVIDAFRKEGWAWGGNWRHPDGMHFQAAYVS